ncbi:type IV secretion system DNA-binding domain-containing protein [Granulicella arctica]|uniref:type IV secretion system DNA-binding domain-containing protein n=1 Tax=Granulicella arctica TaxID=940613 RepID=UPI0021DF7163|nr:type IV secretion system DNA-binding domain-containing protein [Granulicella arctica]
MNSNQQWGRKETIVWPPHAPVYTFSALALGVFATLFFVWQFLRFTETPLRRTYTPTYIQSLIGATFKQHGKYRLLYVGGGKAAPRLALPADFVPGETKLPTGAVFPAELSEATRNQGYTVFYRGPEKDYKRGEFFTDTPQKIFAHLLKYKPSPEELVAWMSDEDEIDRRLKGTELANFAPKDAPQQRSGVLGSLGLVADSLRLLPTREEAQGREWCATEWAEKREGWIFLTSTEAEQEALRPLHSLWIDLLVLRLLTKPKPEQKKVWLVIDELASLQRLPQFHTALTKGRKSDNPIVFGYQGKAQLETIYGHLAEVMLSQPTTKFILRTAEPNAAKWAAEMIGEVEIERVRETVADGKRQGKSFTLDRQIEPLVMKSEVEGLPDLHTFVKINNYVSRFSFPPMSLPKVAEALIPRVIPPHKMWFNPLAPVPVAGPPAAHSTAESGSDPGNAASSKGAPIKEAEAMVPKLELPKAVVPSAQAQTSSISHNL